MAFARQSAAVISHPAERVNVGPISALITNGELRALQIGRTEVLRRLSYPVRDANWNTLEVITIVDTLTVVAGQLDYFNQFQAVDGSFSGRFDLQIVAELNKAILTATVEFKALRPFLTNRAGFALLHPLAGVAGTAMTVRHPAQPSSIIAFPQQISPGQIAKNIAGLEHQIGPVFLDIIFEGEVFEMEDQRNWSDASFKTYCRPLAAPKPFAIEPAAPLRQKIVIELAYEDTPAMSRKSPEALSAIMPELSLAHEPGLSAAQHISAFPGLSVVARLTAETSNDDIKALAAVSDLTLELVAIDSDALLILAQRCHSFQLHPNYVVALPQSYLASHQPEGPWPAGATPNDFALDLRKLFPAAKIGAGSLTNFTEFNRCPPIIDNVDFVTFGNSAIVHAADDMSVIETLEALPHIFRSARVLAKNRPLRLGLMSIGMRSNPYGAGVAQNA